MLLNATDPERAPFPAASAVLDAIDPLLAEITLGAEEIERLGVVPPKINARLAAAGAFTMLIPGSYGGADLRPRQMVRVLEALARADASVAWSAMVSTGMNATLARFSKAVIEMVFKASPYALIRGATAPKGVAEPVEGGYRVKGRWPLGSGSYDYRWVIGNCVVMEGGKPRIGPNGAPETRAVIVPREKAVFLDTWHSVGLKASNSHDFTIDEACIPEAHTTSVYESAGSFDTPLHRLPLAMIISPPHAAVALGIAQGALDDLTEIARTKRPAFDPGRPIKENPVFNYRFGELAIRLEGLRAFLDHEVDAMWSFACGTEQATAAHVAHPMAVASYVQRECVDLVQVMFELAGSNACYDSSPLQRRWRDIRCLGQHVAAGTGFFETIGVSLVSQSQI